ncbi:MAG: hypothetical protein EXS10_00685 [Phycisphaerales bacterium]|nr:hypothetical protein [Phycisphaerales bacterium]
MHPRRAIRTIAIFAFAAWMTLCCCERRVLAEWFGFQMPSSSCCTSTDSAASATVIELPACCANKHCADEAAEAETPAHPEGCCTDKGCCDRFSGPITYFDVPTDQVGADIASHAEMWAMIPSLATVLECEHPPPWIRECAALAAPPPRLLLVLSRRIRI